MALNADINLYKAKTDLSADLVLIASRLRMVSIIVLVVVIGLGSLVGVFYFLLSAQQQQLEAQRDTVTKRIISQAKKEALAIEVKERTSTVSKIIESQKPWMALLETISGFANPPLLQSFAGDETTQLRVSVKAPSVAEAVGVVQGAVRQTLQKRIQKTILNGVSIDKDGAVTMSFTFQQGSAL